MKTTRRVSGLAFVLSMAVAGGLSRGQVPRGPATGGGRAWGTSPASTPALPVGSAASSPYRFMDPRVNPMLNPYLAAVPNAPEVGMLYLLNAQRASGGIGSGRLGGPYVGDRFGTGPGVAMSPASGSRPAAFMPYSASSPSVGADRYFNRLPDRGARAATYFQRNRAGSADRSEPRSDAASSRRGTRDTANPDGGIRPH